MKHTGLTAMVFAIALLALASFACTCGAGGSQGLYCSTSDVVAAPTTQSAAAQPTTPAAQPAEPANNPVDGTDEQYAALHEAVDNVLIAFSDGQKIFLFADGKMNVQWFAFDKATNTLTLTAQAANEVREFTLWVDPKAGQPGHIKVEFTAPGSDTNTNGVVLLSSISPVEDGTGSRGFWRPASLTTPPTFSLQVGQ